MRTLKVGHAAWILASLVTFQTSGVAGTIYVDLANPNCPGTGTASDPFCKIQDGIDAATAGDEILVASGWYCENLDMSDKSIHVRGAIPRPIIDGRWLGSVVRFKGQTGSGAILEGVEVTRGSGTVLGESRYGGGLLIQDASPTVRRCAIYNNLADFGGGVDCSGHGPGRGPRFESCTISKNVVFGSGGGLAFSYCSPTIIGSLIANNHAGRGGAIVCEVSSLVMINCTIAHNFAESSAGLFLTFSLYFSTPVTVANCIIWDNYFDEITALGSPVLLTIVFSNVRGGWPGQGNLNADPSFRDFGSDFGLSRQSPCIDAGTNQVRSELPALDLESKDQRIIDTIDIGADEFGLEWELNGPAISGGPPVSFSAYASCQQIGIFAELYLSQAGPFSPCGYGHIALPDTEGRALTLFQTSFLSQWLALPTAFRRVSLNGCIGAQTLAGAVPSSVAPGTQICFQGFSWDPASGEIVSVSAPESLVVQ